MSQFLRRFIFLQTKGYTSALKGWPKTTLRERQGTELDLFKVRGSVSDDNLEGSGNKANSKCTKREKEVRRTTNASKYLGLVCE